MKNPREKWNRIYSNRNEPDAPAEVLTRYVHLLPPTGIALDLAAGLGANACFLADRGLEAHAWDISNVAMSRLTHPGVAAHLRDVESNPPEPDAFDVIVVSRFLARSICPALAAAMKPGGLLFYQTFVQEKVAGVGTSNPAFLLKRGELLDLFQGLRVLAFHDEGQVGDIQTGLRNESLLVARREL